MVCAVTAIEANMSASIKLHIPPSTTSTLSLILTAAMAGLRATALRLNYICGCRCTCVSAACMSKQLVLPEAYYRWQNCASTLAKALPFHAHVSHVGREQLNQLHITDGVPSLCCVAGGMWEVEPR